jgi:hypothetical protein
MDGTNDKHAWVFVVVQKNGPQESILGQQDPEKNISFIPAFRDRESALQGIHRLARDPGGTFEIQAIIYEDLAEQAKATGHLIFILDGSGRVMTQTGP